MDAEPTQEIDTTGPLSVALLAIANVLIVSGLEIWLIVPVVLREAMDLMDAIYLTTSYVGLILMWLYCLFVEHAHMHERREARWHRRRGYFLQFMALGVYAASKFQDGHPQGAIAIGLIVLLAMAVWNAWMRTFRLAPEQQKALDELLAERDRRFKERVAAEQDKLRQHRFEAVRARYQLPDVPAPVAAKPAEPRFDWPVPEGKHKALVYFIGNGSRVKIGTTSSLRARVSALSLRTSDIVLLIAGDRRMEQAMHKRFADQRVGNTEWFESSGPLADFIRGHNEQALAVADTRG